MHVLSLNRTRTEGEVDIQVDAFVVEAVRGNFHESVVIRGELDSATIPRLQDVLDGVLARRPRRLEIDLSGVTFLSVYAVSVLLATQRHLVAHGAALVLREPSPIVRRLLTLTGTDYLIEGFPASSSHRRAS